MNLISCEKLEKSMVELQFSIDAETFKAAVNNAFKREGKKYAIPGFRKGKAPRHMIEKMYGSDIFHYDAVNDLFPEAYEAAVKEAKIDVVGRPDPEVVSIYVFKRDFLATNTDGMLWRGKISISVMMDTGIIDIDSEHDYLLMEAIAQHLYAHYPEFAAVQENIRD